jgi:tight adherence protein C
MPDMTLTLTLLAVFLSVALLTGSVTYASLDRSSPVRRRLRALQTPSGATALGRAPSALEGSLAASPIVRKVTTFVPKSPKEMNRLQRRLAVAGLHKPRHLAVFVLAEAALPIAAFAGFFVAMGASGIIWGILAAIVGYLLPGLIVERYARKRQKQIRNGLPDALDLLIVSLEAGLAIDQAIFKSAEELRIAYPALAEELHVITVECRAGKPRIEAFKNFATRTQVDDVRSLVAMLVQTDRFGTSIADALRTYADVSRTKRRQRAEERAAKIGVKLVFPLVFCLFPAFFVVTLGPGVIKFVHAFSSSGAFGSSGITGGF